MTPDPKATRREVCTCNGDGIIVTCIDDMCRGSGECIHGDGEKACVCMSMNYQEPDDDYYDD